MSREEHEHLAEGRRSGIPLHRLDNPVFCAAYFATYVAGPWHMLDISPAMWAHGASMPLTMFIVWDVACRMRRLCTADKVDGYTAGRGCFPKAWEPMGGGGGLCAIEHATVGGHAARPAAARRLHLGGCPHHAG